MNASAPEVVVTENVLLKHTFPAHQPLTAIFLTSIGAAPASPDCMILPMPVALSAETFGGKPDGVTTFALQLNRIGFVDEEQQQLGLGGASFWAPVVQATGLQQGVCVCPLLSLVLGSARQLEALLIGLGCEVGYQKKEFPNGRATPG